MNQSNTVRRLENILDEAVTKGGREEFSGKILLQVMKLDTIPRNLVSFYELLSKAEQEAMKLKHYPDKYPRLNRHIRVIETLQNFFITNNIWSSRWDIFANHIESTGVLNALDAVATYLNTEYPKILLEEDFLRELNTHFEHLLSEVVGSDLSKDLKKYLLERIEDILKAIRRYSIDGTEGLEKSAKSLVTDLVLIKDNLKDEEKQNPILNRVLTSGISLKIFLTFFAPNIYDLIGVAPAINDFWIPKYEQLSAGREKIEKIVYEESNLQKIFEKAADTYSIELRKSLLGKEQKALPPSKEDVETNTEKESDS